MNPTAGTLLARRDVAGLAFSSLAYEPGATLGWHVHPRPYLSFVGAGSYTERLAGLTRRCDTSTLLLHPAGERHANQFHDRPVQLLRVESNDSRLLEVPGTNTSGAREPLRHLCRRMLEELRAPDDVTPLALHGLVLELIAGLARSTPSSAGEPRWLDRVDEFLRESFDAPLSLATVAAHAGVHPVHLARTYRRHRRQTVGDRIRELRLDRACRWLAATCDSIADIALRCGFADQSHLARLMRRRLGVTPSQYRARHASR